MRTRAVGYGLCCAIAFASGCSDDDGTSGSTRSSDPEAHGTVEGATWTARTSVRNGELCLKIRYRDAAGGGCAPAGARKLRLFVTELSPARFVAGVVGSGTRAVELNGPADLSHKMVLQIVPNDDSDHRWFVYAQRSAEPRPIAVDVSGEPDVTETRTLERGRQG